MEVSYDGGLILISRQTSVVKRLRENERKLNLLAETGLA
jgi:hypothetical protein